MSTVLCLVAVLLATLAATGCAAAPSRPPAVPVSLNDNGSWCWFQDPRVLAVRGKIIFSTVAAAEGPGGKERAGNIEVTTFDPATGKSTVAVLHARLEADDHDAAGLFVLPDGRLLAMYSKHMTDRLIRYRIATNPWDATDWQPESRITRQSTVTYNNIFQLSAEKGRIYDFYRGERYKPNFLYSDDHGKTWTYGGRLLKIDADPNNRMRPYARYASNGKDTIWFANTDAHPAEYPATSLYTGYIRGGKIYNAAGREIREMGQGAEPSELTCLFKGDPQNQAWICQVELDAAGLPYIAYSIHKTDNDLRYRYARFDGTTWTDTEFAYAGTRLYRTQEHYTGNIALDPFDPNSLYLSTNADPMTGKPLVSTADGQRHWEIFKAVTADGGRTFRITPVTQNSTADNLRPIIPAGAATPRWLLWLRGRYDAYTRYDIEVVGMERS